MNERPESCDHSELEIWQYVDRELPARRLAELSAHMRSCDRCRGLYETFSREAQRCRLAFASGPFGKRFPQRVMARLAAGDADALGVADGRSNPMRRVALLGILFAIPVLGFIAIDRATPVVPTLGEFRISAGGMGGWAKYGFVGGQEFKVVAGTRVYPLRPGHRFEVHDRAVLRLRLSTPDVEDAGTIEVFGPACFWVDPEIEPGEFRGVLAAGRARAEVRPGTWSDFRVQSADAEARVLGTVFTLEVFPGETRLSVERGRVSLVAIHGEASPPVVVEAGGSGRVMARMRALAETVDPGTAPAPIAARAAGGGESTLAGRSTGDAGADATDAASPATVGSGAADAGSSGGSEIAPVGEGAPASGGALELREAPVLDNPVGRPPLDGEEEDPPVDP